MVVQRFQRYTAFALCIILFTLGAQMAPTGFWGRALLMLPGILVLVGIHDVLQTRHSVLRNYPVIGHVRWLVELIRPEIRQYLLEDDNEATPFSRAQRSLRSK